MRSDVDEYINKSSNISNQLLIDEGQVEKLQVADQQQEEGMYCALSEALSMRFFSYCTEFMFLIRVMNEISLLIKKPITPYINSYSRTIKPTTSFAFVVSSYIQYPISLQKGSINSAKYRVSKVAKTEMNFLPGYLSCTSANSCVLFQQSLFIRSPTIFHI